MQRPLTSGPRGWPTGPTFWPLMDWLHGHALQEVASWNMKLEVGGSQTRWPPGHVARPTDQHLVCYRLNQVGNSSLDPYKYPATDGIQNTTLYL
jgi:hypothetical protein